MTVLSDEIGEAVATVVRALKDEFMQRCVAFTRPPRDPSPYGESYGILTNGLKQASLVSNPMRAGRKRVARLNNDYPKFFFRIGKKSRTFFNNSSIEFLLPVISFVFNILWLDDVNSKESLF